MFKESKPPVSSVWPAPGSVLLVGHHLWLEHLLELLGRVATVGVQRVHHGRDCLLRLLNVRLGLQAIAHLLHVHSGFWVQFLTEALLLLLLLLGGEFLTGCSL